MLEWRGRKKQRHLRGLNFKATPKRGALRKWRNWVGHSAGTNSGKAASRKVLLRSEFRARTAKNVSWQSGMGMGHQEEEDLLGQARLGGNQLGRGGRVGPPKIRSVAITDASCTRSAFRLCLTTQLRGPKHLAHAACGQLVPQCVHIGVQAAEQPHWASAEG